MNDRVIFVFSPHPDDDIIACGGTILKKIKEGYSVKIVYLTDGSKSHAIILNITENPTSIQLIKMRTKEAIKAASILGVERKNLFFLYAEDTNLIGSLGIVTAEIIKILSDYKEDIAEIYIPHSAELHQDHNLTHRVVVNAVHNLNIKPIILQYIIWDEEVEIEFGVKLRGAISSASLKVDINLNQRVEIDISSELELKIKALKEHKSQIELISPHQKRPIISHKLFDKVINATHEVFWKYNI